MRVAATIVAPVSALTTRPRAYGRMRGKPCARPGPHRHLPRPAADTKSPGSCFTWSHGRREYLPVPAEPSDRRRRLVAARSRQSTHIASHQCTVDTELSLTYSCRSETRVGMTPFSPSQAEKREINNSQRNEGLRECGLKTDKGRLILGFSGSGSGRIPGREPPPRRTAAT